MASSICAIIPTYNRSAMLRECIDSVLAQSRPVQDIIVVNDGSTDDTALVVESYGPRITLIEKPNGGKASALNVALARCTSQYVWICDDDDIAVPDGIEHLAAALDADDTIGFAFGKYKRFRDGAAGRSYSSAMYLARAEEPSTKLTFLEGMATGQFAMLVRRSLYQRVGPFREDLIRSQDYDMAIRLSRNAKAAYIPKVIFLQRAHDGARGSASEVFPAEKSARTWLQYDQKVLSWVRSEFRLEEFTPTFASQWRGPLAGRAALLQRACVFARRAMWHEAIDDCRNAAELSPAAATPQELRLAEAAIGDVLAWEALGDNPAWIAELRACYEGSEYGRSVVLAACRHLVWHAWLMYRSGDLADGNRMLKILINVVGLQGAAVRAVSSALNKARRSANRDERVHGSAAGVATAIVNPALAD